MELVAEGLTKKYPEVLALNGVSIRLKSGEIHAIVGENGAGKSSLMKVLSGASVPDEGQLRFNGAAVHFSSPHSAQQLGIRMIHQELSLVPELTVAENILLGAEPAQRGVINQTVQRARARTILDSIGQHQLEVDARVATLSLAAQQMTEIAKALAREATLLILDEPTAILSHDESEALFSMLSQLRANGVAIAYITHRMDEVFRIADQITVLRDGCLVSSAPAAECERAEIVRQMVGRELSETFPAPIAVVGDEVLRLSHVRSGLAKDVSFTLRQGEIVALVGLVGSGRTEVLRAIFGAAALESGEMKIRGEQYVPRSPREAIAKGIALLPEDRKAQGLVMTANVRDNTTLSSLRALAAHGIIDVPRERIAVSEWITALGIRAASPLAMVRQLSGGNQQKVVLARWLLANTSILLFDEPTRGVDVGAKSEIYALMRKQTENGAAILMISSELPEALGMADRVVVMRDGRSVGELSREQATQSAVAEMILGESKAA